MDLFFAAVPIAFLIFVMTKKNGLPSTVAFRAKFSLGLSAVARLKNGSFEQGLLVGKTSNILHGDTGYFT